MGSLVRHCGHKREDGWALGMVDAHVGWYPADAVHWPTQTSTDGVRAGQFRSNNVRTGVHHAHKVRP